MMNLPDDLTERDQWVLWQYQTRNGKSTKVPHQVNGRLASSTDPRTWGTFEAVCDAWSRAPKRYAGVGYVFSLADPFAGIDLDHSIDEGGNVKPWAAGMVERFGDTYMEISPSGTGLKMWARGSLPANVPGVSIVGDGSVELYDHARYFCVTGQVFRNAPLEVEDHISDLRQLYDRLTQGKRRWKLEPLEGGRIPCGQQHSTLVSIAGTLRLRRVCDEAIEACLQVINARQCERPGAPEHIARIVSGSRKWGTA